MTQAIPLRNIQEMTVAPLELVESRPPQGVAIAADFGLGYEQVPRSAKKKFMEIIKDLGEHTRENLPKAQARYKKNFDKKVRLSR